jgi:hypothetical protein
MMGGKTTRYCAKCKTMLTKTSLAEFNEHAAACEGADKPAKRKAAVPPQRPQVLARQLRAPRGAQQQMQQQPPHPPPQPQAHAVYVPPPPPVHPRVTVHIEKFPEGPPHFKGLVLDKAHMQEPVLETYENPDLVKELEDVSADELLEMQKKCEWTDGILDRWFGWGGECVCSATAALLIANRFARLEGVPDWGGNGCAAENCGGLR